MIRKGFIFFAIIINILSSIDGKYIKYEDSFLLENNDVEDKLYHNILNEIYKRFSDDKYYEAYIEKNYFYNKRECVNGRKNIYGTCICYYNWYGKKCNVKRECTKSLINIKHNICLDIDYIDFEGIRRYEKLNGYYECIYDIIGISIFGGICFIFIKCLCYFVEKNNDLDNDYNNNDDNICKKCGEKRFCPSCSNSSTNPQNQAPPKYCDVFDG
uniref:EGF-like domain-containing protein n=1 Tax=Parastrongyloides trichosuri TaxID=131310 RepID=A0A0N4ZKS7_PARTI